VRESPSVTASGDRHGDRDEITTIDCIDEVPKTATGTFNKQALREEYGDESLVEGRVPDDATPGS
jgi:acyl-CoA synthetase (AMP-forming)/AMP-acid ligase II